MPLETNPDFVAYLELRDHVRDLAFKAGILVQHCAWNPEGPWEARDECGRILKTGTLVVMERFLLELVVDDAHVR